MTETTVAFPVAVGAAEAGRPTLVLQAKEPVRSALDGTAAGAACDGCTVQPWAWIGDDGATTLGYRRMNSWRKK